MKWACALLAFTTVWAQVGSAFAEASESRLDAFPFGDKKVRVDGLLKEWPKLTPLEKALRGKVKGGAEGLVGYDDQALYVAMRVRDSTFTRGRHYGEQEDYAQLELTVPRPGSGAVSYAIQLFAGEPGRTAGLVKLKGKGKLEGALLVEAPTAHGYDFEARIPWAALPATNDCRSGLRARLLYQDAGEGSVARVATSASKGRLPQLTLEPEYALMQAVVEAKGLDVEPEREAFANLTGDRFLERIAIYDRYLTVTGYNYRGGREFYYQDLRLLEPSALRFFELADLSGDGKAEVVLVRREGTSSQGRDYLEVYTFPSSDAPPRKIFQHEVGIRCAAGVVENEVRLARRGKQRTLVVSRGKHRGLELERWEEPIAGGEVQPALLPWQAIESRAYAFEGGRFDVVEEKEKASGVKAPPARGQRLWSGTRPPTAGGAGSSSRRDRTGVSSSQGQATRVLEPPRPPKTAELMREVYSLYRREQRAHGKARFDFVINTYGDEVPERVLLHGLDLVVFGEHFQDATTYAFTKVALKEPSDVLSVSAADLTGDGYAELIVRGTLAAKASRALGGHTVQRHALLVYKVRAGGIERIFAAETGRTLRKASVLGRVSFVPIARGVEIRLAPGKAIEFTEQSYPFPQDPGPYGGLEPLLLPWGGREAQSYRYDGDSFKKVGP